MQFKKEKGFDSIKNWLFWISVINIVFFLMTWFCISTWAQLIEVQLDAKLGKIIQLLEKR